MSLDKNLLESIAQNLSEFGESDTKDDFICKTTKESNNIAKQVLKSLIVPQEKLKMQIGV